MWCVALYVCVRSRRAPFHPLVERGLHEPTTPRCRTFTHQETASSPTPFPSPRNGLPHASHVMHTGYVEQPSDSSSGILQCPGITVASSPDRILPAAQHNRAKRAVPSDCTMVPPTAPWLRVCGVYHDRQRRVSVCRPYLARPWRIAESGFAVSGVVSHTV